jgi:uncharacterized membrane protein
VSALLATSFNKPDTVSFYNVVLFLHILSAIVAFGILFANPVIFASLRRAGNAAQLAWWHRTQVRVDRMILSPAATLLLACGIYMASDGPYGWKSTFISVGLALLVVIMGIVGSVQTRSGVKAAEIAERGETGPDYERYATRLQWAGNVSALLVAVVVFLMVTKLGAHS